MIYFSLRKLNYAAGASLMDGFKFVFMQRNLVQDGKVKEHLQYL